jgi:hypothetical protein
MSEVAFELIGVALIKRPSNGVPKRVFGSRRGLAQDSLEFGEVLLDGVVIGAVGRR